MVQPFRSPRFGVLVFGHLFHTWLQASCSKRRALQEACSCWGTSGCYRWWNDLQNKQISFKRHLWSTIFRAKELGNILTCWKKRGTLTFVCFTLSSCQLTTGRPCTWCGRTHCCVDVSGVARLERFFVWPMGEVICQVRGWSTMKRMDMLECNDLPRCLGVCRCLGALVKGPLCIYARYALQS